MNLFLAIPLAFVALLVLTLAAVAIGSRMMP